MVTEEGRSHNASLKLESEQLLGQVNPDDDEIDDDLKDSFSPWLSRFPSSDPLSLINISGDEDLQTTIRKLCFDFRDIFLAMYYHHNQLTYLPLT